jgi:hypothetical protein
MAEKKAAQYRLGKGTTYTMAVPGGKETTITADEDGGFSPKNANERYVADRAAELFGGKKEAN